MHKTSRFIILLFVILVSACTTSNVMPTAATLLPTNIVPSEPACIAVVSAPTPGAETPSIFPAVTAEDHMRGAENGLITIVDYSDYQDPLSASLADVTKRLLEENLDTIRLVSRPFPIHIVNDKA